MITSFSLELYINLTLLYEVQDGRSLPILSMISRKKVNFFYVNLLMHQQILTPTFSFFLLSPSESFFLKLCFQHVTPVTNVIHGCVRVCLGVCGCGQVCAGVCGCGFSVSVRECVWVKRVYAGVHEWVGIHGFVQEEFSEYLLETRFLTSANYNPHPLRILLFLF